MITAAGPSLVARTLTVWYAVGLALTSATQLRAAELPIGPGELLLVGWLLMVMLRVCAEGAMTATPVGRAYLLFWTVSIALLCLGMLVSIALQVFETPRLYDFVAFLLSALTSTAFALQRDLRRHIRIAMDVLLHILCTTQFVLAALLLLRVRYVGPIDTFYENERFQGWSMNPNQLAFVLLALPFLAIHRLGEQKTLPRRAWYGVLALLPILPGALCFSNALFFAWISGIAVLSLAAWVRLVAWKDSRFLRRAFWTILVPTAAAGILAFLGPALYRLSVTGLDRGFNYGSHGSDRVNRWRFGLQAAANSPIVGLGPGSFSGPYQSFGGGEAHNTLIDWGSSTGVLGALSFLTLLAFVAIRSGRQGHVVGPALILAILVFSSFHYILRQPVFWFDILAVGALGDPPGMLHRVRTIFQAASTCTTPT